MFGLTLILAFISSRGTRILCECDVEVNALLFDKH